MTNSQLYALVLAILAQHGKSITPDMLQRTDQILHLSGITGK